MVEREAPAFAESLAKIYTVILTEPTLMPEESLRLLRAAALSAIGDKRRPIACSSVWRRLLASIATRAVTAELAPVLTELSQFGVGVSAGVEHVALETRLWHELHGVVVQLDCTNAFNSVDRRAIVEGLERFCPQLLPYFSAIYCGEHMPEMRAERRAPDGNGFETCSPYIISSELGCQQGDPLGPLLFAVALTHALHPANASRDVSSSGGAAGSGYRSSDSSRGAPPQGAPPHTTYLDDLNARLAAVFDDAAAEQVRYIQCRLASIGLESQLSQVTCHCQARPHFQCGGEGTPGSATPTLRGCQHASG